MYAKHQDLEATATFSTYYIGSGQYETMIGRIYTLTLDHGHAYVLEVHDWDGDTNAYLDGEGDGYDGIIVNTYMDKAEAEAEMERRARAASDPEPLPGERPVTHVLADAIDSIIGTDVNTTVSNDRDAVDRKYDRVAVFVTARSPMEARLASQRLKVSLPGASVHLMGATVRAWVYVTDARQLAEAVLA